MRRSWLDCSSSWPSDDVAEMTLIRLAARLGIPAALERARAIAKDAHEREPDRVAMLDLLGEIKDRASVPLLLDLATHGEGSSNAVRTAAFGSLGRFDDEAIATALLAAYPHQAEAWRFQARELLLSRASWARAFLAAVDSGKVPPQDVTLEQLGRFATLRSGGSCRLGPQALGRHPRGDPRREARRGSSSQQRPQGRPW